uniref:Uncharacterized protein n=1 Tax=Arundo donax TaxID=35708 RepID=A0A0A9BQY6_ARUDO
MKPELLMLCKSNRDTEYGVPSPEEIWNHSERRHKLLVRLGESVPVL